MSPTYQVDSSWWGEPSSSSSEYELKTSNALTRKLWRNKLWSFYWNSNTYSSASFFMPSHSFIFFCLVPFCVNQLKTMNMCVRIRVTLLIPKGNFFFLYFRSTIPHRTYIKYWSLILRSCRRSGLRLFIFLSISLLSETCCLRSCSSLHLLSWISFTRDFKRSELLWILIWDKKKQKTKTRWTS